MNIFFPFHKTLDFLNAATTDNILCFSSYLFHLRSHDDVVDGDVDELDKEADEAHDGEADGGRDGDLLEFWKERKDWF